MPEVFLSAHGRALTRMGFTHMLHKYRGLAATSCPSLKAKHLTPHVLRHTFAVTAVQKGISLPALQRLLGHDRLTTTEVYLNLSPEEVVREFREKW